MTFLRIPSALLIGVVLMTSAALGDVKSSSGKDQEVTYEFDDAPPTQKEREFQSLGDLQLLFKNPALLASLSSSTEVINQSIETLIDVVFYSMMDHRLDFPFTPRTSLIANIDRRVFTTAAGAYIVVDRVGLGPSFRQVLGHISGIPIYLGVDGNFDVYDVYLRTDGIRIAEQAELPFWRAALNNWVGVLPILSNILPPSFNPNELYDPLHQLETPFLFPLDKRGFKSMPIGGIRSYVISGGIQVAADPMEIASAATKEMLAKFQDATLALPYTIFNTGEYRINVLRRDAHTAWVGVNGSKRFGHRLAANLTGPVSFLTGVIPYWKGVQAEVSPLQAQIALGRAWITDELYEFDLRNPEAEEAYLAAVRGDFTVARAKLFKTEHDQVPTGVKFHFTRHQDRNEDDSGRGRQFLVYAAQSSNNGSSGQVEIKDTEGTYHLLETDREGKRRESNILTGGEESTSSTEVTIKVRKISPSSPQAHLRYEILRDTNPILAYMNLKIQDSYVDSREYDRYLERLRFFSTLPLEHSPAPQPKDPDRSRKWRQRTFLMNPALEHRNLNVTNTIVGHLGAQASICFPAQLLSKAASKPLDKQWEAFARAFDISPERWSSSAARDSLFNRAGWLTSTLAYPFRILDIQSSVADAWVESQQRIAILRRLGPARPALETLNTIHALFDTTYPDQLARALTELAGPDVIPRRVTFFAKPSSSTPSVLKKSLKEFNGKTFEGGRPFPEDTRYRAFRAKLAAFYPQEMSEQRDRPSIRHVTVRSQPLEGRVADPGPHGGRGVFVRMELTRLLPGKPFRVYIKLEQGGRLQFGKLVLGEQSVLLSPDSEGVFIGPYAKGLSEYGTFITGPDSPLLKSSPVTALLFDRTINGGGNFQLTLMVSQDGKAWSDQRVVNFRFDRGRLLPPEKKAL